MQRLTITTQFRGEAAEPSGEPPKTDPRCTSESVEGVTADGADAGITHASYENHVTFTSESTFTETGTIGFGDGELDIDTIGEGTIGPSREDGVMQGAVMWRITAGRGRFEGAGGVITSNFLLRLDNGEVEDRQVAVVFLP